MKEIKSLSKALAGLNSCQTAVDKIMAAESASAVRDIVRYENVSEVARRSNALSETSLAEMGMASALHKESLVEQAMRTTASGQSLRDKTMGAASAASIRDITASCEAVSGAAKLADGLVGTSCLKSAAASAASIRDITASCETVSGVAKLANELAGTSYLKIASALHRESLLEQAVKAAASSQSLWDKTVAAASASSIKDIAASYKEISGATKLVSTLSETSRLSLAGSGMASVRYKESLVGQAMKAAASSQSLWDKTMVSMVTPSVIEKATDVLRNSRSIFLEESNYLAAMAESVSQLEFEEKFVTNNSYENPEIVAEVSELLATSPSGHSFIQKFRNSHPLVQQFIYFIFIQIIFSQINSISANLLTPHVELYLHEKNITQREQINKIKKLPLTVKNIDTNQLRFITGNNVRLRKSPSTNSEILDEMELGKIVTVLSKKRNWINVEYTYKDGTAITGWVFTIYTKRFKK
jgi:hypothetical protein